MATLSELRTRVRMELGETSEGYWTDTQLDNYVNAAAARFSVDTGILLVPPRKADAIADYALYTLPADCPGPQAVVAVFYNGTELDPTSPAALMRLGKKPQADTGTPTHWYTVTDGGDPCLALYPIPVFNLDDGIVVWFWKLATEMTNDSSTCDIPDEYLQGSVYGAAELAFLAKRENTQAGACRKLYMEEVQRARSSAESLLAASLQHNDANTNTVRAIF